MAKQSLSQEALSKIYIALWLANRDAAAGRHWQIMINTALPSQTIWNALDHETRIATRSHLKSEFATGRWKTINPLDDEYWAKRGGREH